MNPPKADPSAPASARGTDHWPIFVLSLEGDEARRAPLLNSLAAMGLEAEVLIGVDGRGGLPDWAEAEVDRTAELTWDYRTSRYMTDGELACALSHVRAYRKVIDDGLPGAIIFEDDALVGEPFRQFILAEAYAVGDMVLLGHKKTWVRRFSKISLCDGAFGYRIVTPPIGAYAYTISAFAAKYLLKHATPVCDRADWPCDISRLDCLAADPHIVGHPADQAAQSLLETDRRATREEKLRSKKALRFFSKTYWFRILRKRLDPQRIRKVFGRRIA